MKRQVLDITGKKVGEIELNDLVFGIIPNENVMNLYVRVFRSNQRQGNASTKTRGDVSGSGKKPWAQKGTGRARVGDKRNPVWVKGGVAHGPKTKSWYLELPKKVKQLALKSALSYKTSMDRVYIVDKLNIEKPKTKEMTEFLNALGIKSNTILVLDKVDPVIIKSSSNIKNLDTSFVENLNAFEVLLSKNVIITTEAVKKLEERFSK